MWMFWTSTTTAVREAQIARLEAVAGQRATRRPAVPLWHALTRGRPKDGSGNLLEGCRSRRRGRRATVGEISDADGKSNLGPAIAPR